MRRVSLAAATAAMFAAGLSVPAAAQEVVYECSLKPYGIGGGVPESIWVGFVEGRAEAMVVDANIGFVHGDAIQVPVRSSGNTRRMRWELELPSQTSGTVDVAYSLNLNIQRLTAELRVDFIHYDNTNMGGRGTCQRLQ